MLLSGQVPYRTNSCQLFWNGLFHKKTKKNKKKNRGVEDKLFKRKQIFFDFSLYPRKFQAKWSSTPRNLVKLCMLHSSEISKRQKTKTSGNFTWIFLGLAYKFHFVFNWPLEILHAISWILLEEIVYPHPSPRFGFFLEKSNLEDPVLVQTLSYTVEWK